MKETQSILGDIQLRKTLAKPLSEVESDVIRSVESCWSGWLEVITTRYVLHKF
jgi:hypothetical protein